MEEKTTQLKCAKCGGSAMTTGEMHTAGNFWTKFLNVENLKFTTLSCDACGYTEIYKKGKAKLGENVLDFFGN